MDRREVIVRKLPTPCFGFVILLLSHSHKLSGSTKSTPSTSLRNHFLLAGKMYFLHPRFSFMLHRVHVDFMAHILINSTSHSIIWVLVSNDGSWTFFSKGGADAQLSAHNQCI